MARRARSEMIEETRGKLVTAARDAFGRLGYADTSMDDLTAAADLTRGALYHHFGDKKGLLRAVVTAMDAEMDERLNVVSATPDLWAGFVGRCRLYLETALEPDIQRIVLKDAPTFLGPDYLQASRRACHTSLTERLSTMMATGVIRGGDAETLAHMINGALVDAALWIAGAADPAPRLASAIANLDLLLSGLKAPGRS